MKIEMPSREELLKQLEACKTGDNEADHINAEEILLKLINDKEVTRIWNRISSNFWYA